MQVLCPSCSTAYEIPPPVRPRRLRCARCDTEWRAMPPEPPEPPDAGAAEVPAAAAAEIARVEAAPSPQPALPDSEPGPQKVTARTAPLAPVIAEARRATVPPAGADGTGWALAWLVSLVLIGAAVLAIWHLRAPIEQVWPPSLRLFRLVPGGVPV